nr:uncharacterized protein LOC127326303 [Lolium perenne]
MRPWITKSGSSRPASSPSLTTTAARRRLRSGSPWTGTAAAGSGAGTASSAGASTMSGGRASRGPRRRRGAQVVPGLPGEVDLEEVPAEAAACAGVVQRLEPELVNLGGAELGHAARRRVSPGLPYLELLVGGASMGRFRFS